MAAKRVSGVRSFEDLPLVLTVTELARVLGISRGTAYAMVNQGQIRSVRAHQARIVVPRSALADFLNGKEAPR